MSVSEFQKQLFLSSVQLNCLDGEMKPIGFASGCLIDYCNKRLLLTVSHTTGDQRNWAIQLKYVPGKGTLHHQLGAMNFLAKASLSNPKFEDIDFSYVEVPSDIWAYRQELLPPNIVKAEVPITVHRPSLEEMPKKSENYGFCGSVFPTYEEHFGQFCVGYNLRIYHELKYVRTESDYHIFSLPFEHPGHEHFKGCSGAPILNQDGHIVGLVCKGVKEENEIWSISLKTYKLAIAILVGNVKGMKT